MRTFNTPATLNVDAYQVGHFKLIPPGMENFQASQYMVRKPMYPMEYRALSMGLAAYVALHLREPIKLSDVMEARDFYHDFHAVGQSYPFPYEMFMQVVQKFNGILPICITGVLDGTCHYIGEPTVQVWTDIPGMGELVGWIESDMLPYLWVMGTVATRGRIRKEHMMAMYKHVYKKATDAELRAKVEYQFHDFGRRGAANSQLSGIAHLLNFLGTDTMDAAYAATRYLNGGHKFGCGSIMAAAHRTITPWPTEDAAYTHNISAALKDGLKIFAIVADSYDYFKGMEKLASFAPVLKENGATLVARPDSGDPVECVMKGLDIFDAAFGHTTVEGGYKVLNNARIILGDWPRHDGNNEVDADYWIFAKIYPAMFSAGWSLENIAFGMGEQNHMAVRSTMEAAYKTCAVGDAVGGIRPVMKGSNSRFKRSLPGVVGLDLSTPGIDKPRVYPISMEELRLGRTGDLRVAFDGRPGGLQVFNQGERAFEAARHRAFTSWMDTHPNPWEDNAYDNVSPEIRKLQEEYLQAH